MKISEILKLKKPVFSFEFFPPKAEMSTLTLGVSIGELKYLRPDFVSVTYGAGGSARDFTFSIVDHIENKIGLNTMAHYTCVGATKDKVVADLKALKENKIENLMLLRGDPPKGAKTFVAEKDGFSYASELVEFSKSIGDFSIGVAGYPEKHIEATDMKSDMAHLKTKVDAGADFIVTQMFFDNKHYFDFVNMARDIGIECPIIPGIMPITNYKSISKFAAMTGTEIPDNIVEQFKKVDDNPEKMIEVGVNVAFEQCLELLQGGAPGLHFYTLNRSSTTLDIFKKLNVKSPIFL